MIIPVRCFTCGKVIGNKWTVYLEQLVKGEAEGDVLDSLGVDRYCCRRVMLTHVDLIEKLLVYDTLAGATFLPRGEVQEPTVRAPPVQRNPATHRPIDAAATAEAEEVNANAQAEAQAVDVGQEEHTRRNDEQLQPLRQTTGGEESSRYPFSAASFSELRVSLPSATINRSHGINTNAPGTIADESQPMQDDDDDNDNENSVIVNKSEPSMTSAKNTVNNHNMFDIGYAQEEEDNGDGIMK